MSKTFRGPEEAPPWLGTDLRLRLVSRPYWMRHFAALVSLLPLPLSSLARLLDPVLLGPRWRQGRPQASLPVQIPLGVTTPTISCLSPHVFTCTLLIAPSSPVVLSRPILVRKATCADSQTFQPVHASRDMCTIFFCQRTSPHCGSTSDVGRVDQHGHSISTR